MPQTDNTAANSSVRKRVAWKRAPLSGAEKQKNFVSRKKETHTAINVFIRKQLKAELVALCEAAGVTQTEMIERWISQESTKQSEVESELSTESLSDLLE
ncbi:replication regulatory protein RepA [Klebsiella michiganensis]|uniref:replication regulatory protein RepA n=1 Tax=Klebsiella michiganensis TaxID=1134687 RepID=UPI0032DB84DB